MSSLTLKRTLRERAGRAVRLSSAMSKDAYLQEVMLPNFGQAVQSQASACIKQEDEGLNVDLMPRKRWQVRCEVVSVKRAEITLDPSAFAGAEEEIEVDLPVPPLPCREIILEIVDRQPAEFRFVPEEFEGYGEIE